MVQDSGGVGGGADTGPDSASSANSSPAKSASSGGGAPPQAAFAADTGNANGAFAACIPKSASSGGGAPPQAAFGTDTGSVFAGCMAESWNRMVPDHDTFREWHGKVAHEALLGLQMKVIRLVGTAISNHVDNTSTASNAAAVAMDAAATARQV